MRPDPTILAFDTSAAHCAAALLSGGRIVASRVEGMERGQAERLVPLLEEVLGEQDFGWRDLDAIGVGTGPGNFTGVRIAVSAARGLALSLGIPAAGISAFEAMAGQDESFGDAALVSIPAPRGMVYVCQISHGRLAGAPSLLDPADSHLTLPVRPAHLIGEAAQQIGSNVGATWDARTLARDADTIAKLVALRVGTGEAIPRPAPVYVRPPDAAPSADLPPRILDEATRP